MVSLRGECCVLFVAAVLISVSTLPLPATAAEEAAGNYQENSNKIGLEPRLNDRNFVRDIVERLHALDADIGKLLYNSTTMYAPDDQAIATLEENSKGGERFSDVLSDLDSLQDEIGLLVSNATKSRQYNILVRLRPLNTLLYRIRHNLHLMRNSLVAINTVSSIEKLGNSVLDSTLQAFMKPDADLSEEIGDHGNYDINLDKFSPEPAGAAATGGSSNLGDSTNSTNLLKSSNTSLAPPNLPVSSTPVATSTSSTTTSTTTTTTTTTQKPSTTTTGAPTTRRAQSGAQRAPPRRNNANRNNQRNRSTTPKPPPVASSLASGTGSSSVRPGTANVS